MIQGLMTLNEVLLLHFLGIEKLSGDLTHKLTRYKLLLLLYYNLQPYSSLICSFACLLMRSTDYLSLLQWWIVWYFYQKGCHASNYHHLPSFSSTGMVHLSLAFRLLCCLLNHLLFIRGGMSNEKEKYIFLHPPN